MAARKANKQKPKRDVQTNTPRVGDLNPELADDEILSEEELERAQAGWGANDESAPAQNDNTSDRDEADADIEEAENALTDMNARERRRDQSYRTGGDDYSPGIDTSMDSNAQAR